MKSYSDTVYAKATVEFVTVANDYCTFLTTANELSRQEFAESLQRFIPLIYYRGSLLPKVDGNDEGLIEDTVTEEEYNDLFAVVRERFGEYDDYLEIFDEADSYRDEPVVQTISEKCADIYQDLKNFLNSYRTGVEPVMEEALWTLNNSFELFWGKACADVMKALHQAVCRLSLATEDEHHGHHHDHEHHQDDHCDCEDEECDCGHHHGHAEYDDYDYDYSDEGYDEESEFEDECDVYEV